MTVAAGRDDELAMSVAQAAATIGLTAATLRTWDRRYGLSPSIRTPGGHRRYDSGDLVRLRTAALLVTEGIAPASAATAAINWPLAQCEAKLAGQDFEADEGALKNGRAGGGRTLPSPKASAELRGLTRAAMALDGEKITALMDEAIDEHGVVGAWDSLAVPALQAVGDRWSATGSGVEIEHVTSDAIARSLDRATTSTTRGRPVLLACTPNEHHSLPLLALHAALASENIPVVKLGAQVPADALADAICRLRPRAVVLWATMPANLPSGTLDAAINQRPPIQVFVAGPGWTSDADFETMQHLDSLSTAVDAIAPR